MNAPVTTSIDELHYRLGKMLEYMPGKIARIEPEAKPFDSNAHPFRDIAPAPHVDTAAGDRLQEWAASERERMGEKRWAQLQAEWGAS